MANPFLVLGGVAVGIVVATMGVLQVPGWVKSAQDAAAVNDLANIRAAQAAHSSEEGRFTDDFDLLSSDRDGLGFNLSGGVDLVEIAANDDAWCASVLSASGTYFAATSATTDYPSGSTPAEAVTAANCAPDLVGSFPTAPDSGAGGGSIDPQAFAAMFTFNCPTTGPATVEVQLPLHYANGTATWSDGTTDDVNYTDAAPEYLESKTLTAGVEYKVQFEGTFDEIYSWHMSQESADCYRSMDAWADSSLTTLADDAFYGMRNLTSVPANLPPTVESTAYAFTDATSFNSPNVARWDMSNVSSISGMFDGATAFQQDINGWHFESEDGATIDEVFANTNYQGDIKDWTFAGEDRVYITDIFGSAYGGSADGWSFTNDMAVYYDLYLDGVTGDLSDWTFNNGGRAHGYFNTEVDTFSGTLNNWTYNNSGRAEIMGSLTGGFSGTMSGMTFANSDVADIELRTNGAVSTGTARDWTISTPGAVFIDLDAQWGTFNGDYSGWNISESFDVNVNIQFGGASGTGSVRDWTFTNPGWVYIDDSFSGSTFTGSFDGWTVRNGEDVEFDTQPAYNDPEFLGSAEWTLEPAGQVIIAEW